MVSRVYVEKKLGFDGEAKQLMAELRTILGIEHLESVRLINRYDVEGISAELFHECVSTVFSEPQSDDVCYDLPDSDGAVVFAVEFLPGQFDQRASSASECIQLISQGQRPLVRSAKVYMLGGTLSHQDTAAIKRYVINPIEAQEAALHRRETLKADYPKPDDVELLEGFLKLNEHELKHFIDDRGLAMDLDDLIFCQRYFAAEGRAPTITEIKMVDTYWSDHCRHTTFGTQLQEVSIEDEEVQAAFDTYLNMRKELNRQDKPICLMDMATIGARYLKAKGLLTGVDESEEINACTVKVNCDVDGREEDWLYLFKNETHNHPTEIEPYGGAATCVGGAIRDPLSGRSYVYQAMRLTGAANPLVAVDETLPGKLSQRKLVTTAAAGFSSYGNQIGLATGQVHEVYHPGYAAKRMEIGAVVGATPADHVRREAPLPGDVIILLGGRTGRDGIGGATGSSKAHNKASLDSCGAEVQKGNPPVERKIQRLFRRGDACRMIKRCNDFGAGGVAVAVGELAEGLLINLDSIPKKYEGLNGTELALAESQERMAVALAKEDVSAFMALAREENLEATPIASVTQEPRVRMVWRGRTIVDVSRKFLASNGAPKYQSVRVLRGGAYQNPWTRGTLAERIETLLTSLNICCNKGLVERFDSTIGAASALVPFGGRYQLTPTMAMVAKLPVLGETTTCSGMAWGFNPFLSEVNQFEGSYLAVVESIAKLAAAGFSREDMYLTFQEYFERLTDQAHRWGKPVAALLGALQAQIDLEVAAIGGKDSMSGSFENLDVPPTLVSFATAVGSIHSVMSPEFKRVGSRVVALRPRYQGLLPEPNSMKAVLELVRQLITNKQVHAVSTLGYGGAAEGLFKMCLGNAVGLDARELDEESLFTLAYGSFIIELAQDACLPEGDGVEVSLIGTTTAAYEFCVAGQTFDLAYLQQRWEERLQPVFPYSGSSDTNESKVKTIDQGTPVPVINCSRPLPLTYSGDLARPRVLIPVFPGNNCEYDSSRAFEKAGAVVETFIVNNLSAHEVAESTQRLVRAIKNSQIIMLPGGFSGGDEPDGSAKFITAFFRAPEVSEAVSDLLDMRDGLMLGICNGFQALVKLGLVPYGHIRPMDENCPTLTFNTIGRHQSRLVHTRVASSLSPWFSHAQVGDVHVVPVSHGEGRFVASEELLKQMVKRGQVAAQYVDECGVPSMDLSVNPNGSAWAIEAITSPDGRILGKMGHSERYGSGLYQNVPGDHYQPLFEAGVSYFSH